MLVLALLTQKNIKIQHPHPKYQSVSSQTTISSISHLSSHLYANLSQQNDSGLGWGIWGEKLQYGKQVQLKSYRFIIEVIWIEGSVYKYNRSQEASLEEFSIKFRGIFVDNYLALFQLQQITNLLQQIFLLLMLHLFSAQHLHDALQFRMIQENFVISHHQQLANHQDLILTILGKTIIVDQLAQLVRDDQVIPHQIKDGLLHLDDVRCTKLLTGKSSQLAGMVALARIHLERQAKACQYCINVFLHVSSRSYFLIFLLALQVQYRSNVDQRHYWLKLLDQQMVIIQLTARWLTFGDISTPYNDASKSQKRNSWGDYGIKQGDRGEFSSVSERVEQVLPEVRSFQWLLQLSKVLFSCQDIQQFIIKIVLLRKYYIPIGSRQVTSPLKYTNRWLLLKVKKVPTTILQPKMALRCSLRPENKGPHLLNI